MPEKTKVKLRESKKLHPSVHKLSCQCPFCKGKRGEEYHPSPEQVTRMIKNLTGKKRSPEAKENYRKARLGKHQSDESNEKNRQAHLGKRHINPNCQCCICKAKRHENIGKSRPKEICVKISKALTGISKSEEHKKHLKEAWIIRKQKSLIKGEICRD